MAIEETEALWATPGRSWTDIKLTSTPSATITLDDGRELDVYVDDADGRYVVFVEEENAFCQLTYTGLAAARAVPRDDPWDDWEEDECPCRHYEFPPRSGDPQVAHSRKTGLKPTHESRREDAEAAQPLKPISRSDRMRSPGLERRLERKRANAYKVKARMRDIRRRQRERNED